MANENTGSTTRQGGPQSMEEIRDGLIKKGMIKDGSVAPVVEATPAAPKPEENIAVVTTDKGVVAAVTTDPLKPKVLEVKTDDKRPDSDDKKQNVTHFRKLAKENEEKAAKFEADLAKTLEERNSIETRAKTAEEKARELEADLKNKKIYEDMYALESSPEYQSEIVEPLTNTMKELYEFAKAYGVSEVVIDHALAQDSVAAQNKTLSDAFKDVIAVSQLQPMVARWKNGLNRKRELDRRPSEARLQLKQEAERKALIEAQRNKDDAKALVDYGWEDALKNYKNYELTKKYLSTAGDNQARATAIEREAKGIYDSAVEGMFGSGITQLSKEQVRFVAALSQKGVMFDYLVKDVQGMTQELEETRAALAKFTGVKPSVRASIGSHEVGATSGALPATGKLPTREQLTARMTELSRNG